MPSRRMQLVRAQRTDWRVRRCKKWPMEVVRASLSRRHCELVAVVLCARVGVPREEEAEGKEAEGAPPRAVPWLAL